MSLTSDQQKAFEILQSSLAKSFGPGTIKILGGDEVSDLPRFSSGIPSVDIAIGGGYPKGRHIEIYGPESSGKTTLVLHAIAEAQKNGELAAFIDAEHALDINYARTLGVNTDNLIISQPDTAEEALTVLEQLVSSGLAKLIVVDSVAALVPKVEADGELTDSSMGVMARLMSRICRVVTPVAARNDVTVFWINQIRSKIGVMFGSPETTTGGNALKFYSSIRLDVRRTGQVKDGEEAVANETTVKVVKNKTAPPYRVAQFQIKFGHGVDKTLDLVRIAVEKSVIDKSGAWYSFKSQRLGQGEANTVNTLNENPTLLGLIQEELGKRMAQPLVKTPEVEIK